jgi:D-alanyl-D-alanine carboxypeptidase
MLRPGASNLRRPAAVALLALAIGATPADARPRTRAPAPSPAAQGWHPGYAAIVVDAKTGKVLHEANADATRHPASLTKIMTLYLLFEQLEAGRMKLSSDIKFSARAAAQPPSKLGLGEDETLEVETAIKALVTRSANDVAVAVAEAIGGSEENFARLMTRKARALGMSRTTFKNASGLPDKEQVTTARDLSILGRAIQERFPRHYKYFAIKSFHWKSVGIRNHNRLLGSIEGLDGIKTGYTRASGFNLVSSVRARHRHLVAVVLGGNTAAARDARMRELIRASLPRAFAGVRTAPRIVEAAPAPVRVASATRVDAPAAPPPAAPRPGSAEPLRPTPVKTFYIRKTGETVLPARPGTLGVLPASSLLTPDAAAAKPLQPDAPATTATMPAPPPTAAPAETLAPAGAPGRVGVAAPAAPLASAAEPKAQAKPEPAAPTPAPAGARPRGPWVIQIGAFPDERQAIERLDQARSKLGGALAKADPYTEKTAKGSSILFRARFAVIDEATARRASNLLKRSDIACFAMKN